MGRKRKAGIALNRDKMSHNCPETTIAILEKHPLSSSAITTKGASDTGYNVHSNCNGVSPKSETKAVDVVVRRSCRLMNSVLRTEGLQLGPTMGHIDISESNVGVPLVKLANTKPVLNERVMSDELPHVQPVVTAPNLNQRTMEAVQPVVTAPILNERSMEGVQRVVTAPSLSQRTMEAEIPNVPSVGTLSIVNNENLVDKIGFLAEIFCEYVSKTDKQAHKAMNEGSSTYLNYKSLYIGSQKKIESLTAENFHISRKLEFALGKIEVYEKTIAALCASKEVVLFPSPQPLKKHALQGLASPPAVIGRESSSPEPEKPKKRKYKKKNAVSRY